MDKRGDIPRSPPYAFFALPEFPDLAKEDFFVFAKMYIPMIGERFDNIEAINKESLES